MKSGYNWPKNLTHFAAISGVLAGFCITFIALILGESIADLEIYNTGVTCIQLAILCFGFSTVLFICSTQFFLLSAEFDVYSIPEPYRIILKENYKEEKKDWIKFEEEQEDESRRNEKIGRHSYNIAIFSLFGGLFFSIAPYNVIIAGIISILGILLESWQILR